MLQSGFVRDVEECAKKYQINVKNIAFEITETFLIDAFTEIVDKLKLLKDLGFSIHLDDFGTGYSSMLYLKELPIDTIKVDKEFVKTIVYDQFSRAIVAKVISLAKSLDLNVIVEGVETEEQNQIVIKSGCNIIQGFLISRAVPESEMREILKKYNRPRK
jgi:EAL domain-containing protein (putative c-di-GMP-specific phosphodiesterase class I)